MMHIPRKRFGQHFLQDKNIIQRLIEVIQPLKDQHLIEIGPGLGALTLPLLQKIHKLDVIELDRDVIPLLKKKCENQGELIIHEQDVLTVDFSTLLPNSKHLRIVGNLPYNISTPLIFHLLQYAQHIQDMYFMLQKEVVDRLAAKPRSSDYGRLSIMVQFHCEVTALFEIPPSAFQPPPKVFSRIVKLIPYQTLPYTAKNYALFSELVKTAFNQRRKTLRNSLKSMVDEACWEKTSIKPTQRPEELSVQEFVDLSNLLGS